jgi:hypothetical protein
MPSRIVKFLNEMDVLRENSNIAVDEALKEVDLKPVILDPDKAGEAFKLMVVKFISKNRKLFAQALLEGKKLAKTL